MRANKILAVPLAAALAFAPSALSADEYKFIVSGYPAENESYSTASSGTSLETAARTARSGVSPMEARYRTWDESNTSALRSDKRGLMIIVM